LIELNYFQKAAIKLSSYTIVPLFFLDFALHSVSFPGGAMGLPPPPLAKSVMHYIKSVLLKKRDALLCTKMVELTGICAFQAKF
jgi:hypothetical protein